MRKIVLRTLLLIGLFTLGCSNAGYQAPNPPSGGDQAVDGLKIENPAQAKVSEMLAIKVIDDGGKLVPGVRLYSPEYLGDTASDGSLQTFFKQPGDYQLLARKGIVGEPGFAEVKSEIRIIPGPVELEAFEGIAPLLPPGETYIGEQHYKPGMTVRFRFKNIGDREITLNNSAPWQIQTVGGKTVFEPVAAQVIVEVGPGEYREWTWDQKDNENRQVGEGGYLVVFKCSERGYGLRFWVISERMIP